MLLLGAAQLSEQNNESLEKAPDLFFQLHIKILKQHIPLRTSKFYLTFLHLIICLVLLRKKLKIIKIIKTIIP